MREFFLKLKRENYGQSLIEILIAIAIGIIIIGAAAAIIIPALRINNTVNEAKVAANLGKELIENVTAFAGADWHKLEDITATTATSFYFLTTSTLGFQHATGTEQITVGTTTYSRWFLVESVCRSLGLIATSTFGTDCGVFTYDPSTKKVTVYFNWPESVTSTISTYLTRFRSRSLSQTNWSKGSTSSLMITSSTTDYFSTSTNINFSSSTGQIKIMGI